MCRTIINSNEANATIIIMWLLVRYVFPVDVLNSWPSSSKGPKSCHSDTLANKLEGNRISEMFIVLTAGLLTGLVYCRPTFSLLLAALATSVLCVFKASEIVRIDFNRALSVFIKVCLL